MNKQDIEVVSEILRQWNPLGEKASAIDGLEGYKYEAMDILSTCRIGKKSMKDSVSSVLTQAFGITLDHGQLSEFSAKIEKALSSK